MTISANYKPIEYIGNGVARNFVPPFKFFDNEIVVTINGNITKAYEILNGTVIFNTAPADGAVIVFKRNVPLSQDVTFIEGENFPANDFEYSLDRIYMALQELKYKIDSSGSVAELTEQVETIENNVNKIQAQYATKTEVDDKIGDIDSILDDINGESV